MNKVTEIYGQAIRRIEFDINQFRDDEVTNPNVIIDRIEATLYELTEILSHMEEA